MVNSARERFQQLRGQGRRRAVPSPRTQGCRAALVPLFEPFISRTTPQPVDGEITIVEWKSPGSPLCVTIGALAMSASYHPMA